MIPLNFLSTGTCGSQGSTESETTQSGGVGVTSPNEISGPRASNSENLDENSTLPYIILGSVIPAATAVVAVLGAFITLLCTCKIKRKSMYI